MNKIERLFKQRDKTYQTHTDRILKSLSAVIDGVVQFLHLTKELAQGQLTWQNIQMQKDVVMLIGIIEYPPGATFATSQGDQMVVSKENKDYFTRILRLGLPVDLVEKGNAEDVLKFLSSAEAEEKTEVVELPENLAGIQDFDLDDLTDEQKITLLVRADDKKVH